MKENTIIVLDTNEKFLILNELFYNENKYFVGIGINEDMSIKSNNIRFFEIDKSQKELNLFIVEDNALLVKLIQIAKRL